MDTLKKYALVITLLLTFSGMQVALGQDTCKSYNVPNPHGLAMTIKKIWVVDSVNFQVISSKQLPYDIAANGTVDFEVCILPRDGKTRSTQVRYINTHGTSSYNVTLTPPGALKVQEDIAGEAMVFYPNPAQRYVSAKLSRNFTTTSKISVEVVGVDGKMHFVDSSILEGLLNVNLHTLPSGVYSLFVKDVAKIVGSSQIVIQD